LTMSECIIKRKNQGSALVGRIAAIVGYVLLAILLCVLIIALAPPPLFVPLFLIAAAFVALVVFVTWKFLCVEYEIVIGNGELCASAIYGRSVTRRLLSVTIKDISEIGVYDDQAYERLCSMSLQKNTLCISSLSAPLIYYALYDNGKDRCVLYFETNERGMSILKQDNPSAFKQNRSTR